MIAKAVKTLADRYDPSASDPPLAARVRLAAGDEAHDVILDAAGARLVEANGARPDALLSGSAEAWRRAADRGGAFAALGPGGLRLRHNLHVGTGFLAATAAQRGNGGLCLRMVETPHGPIATAQAGSGPPLLALHGLGGTKASFLPTLALMSGSHRVIAADRVDRVVLLSPAMAWLRPRRWAPVVRLLRPELSVLPMPVEGLVRRLVPGGDSGWAAAGVDEFLRSYTTARGRLAFNAVARNIYLDEPHGKAGLWIRLGGMQHESLFIWGRRDRLVPIGFMKHVERAFPAARHLELDCGHVPQVERPIETHDAIRAFLG